MPPLPNRPTRLARVPREPYPVPVYAPRPIDVELNSPWVTYRTDKAVVSTIIPGLTRSVWPELYVAVTA